MSNDDHSIATFSIQVKGGVRDGQRFEITSAGFVVGRGPRCDLVLEDPGISKKHIRFYVREGLCYVEDLGSRNGFTIDGKRLWKRCLSDGEVVELGLCRLLFRGVGTAKQSPAPDRMHELLENIDVLKHRQDAQRSHPALLPLHPLAVCAAAMAALAWWMWFFGLAAALLGGMVCWEIHSRGQQRGTILAALALAIGILAGGISIWRGTLYARADPPPGDASALQCRENLLRIHKALRTWARHNAGVYPESLADIVPQLAGDEDVLLCPGAVAKGARYSGYLFPGAGGRDLSGAAVLVCDPSADDHSVPGGLVLLADGHVQWKTGREMESVLTRLWAEGTPAGALR